MVGHCLVNSVQPREMVPAETGVVDAAAGVTVKLSVKELDLAWLDSAALLCQRFSQRLQRDQIVDRFPLCLSPYYYVPHEFSACEDVQVVPI